MNQYTNSTTKSKRKHKISDKFLSHNTAIGDYGEKHILKLLRQSGYKARKATRTHFQGDLWTLSTQTQQTAKIEVKTAIASGTGTYSFCLKKQGHTDYCHSDYVILLLLDNYHNHYVYCIPCHVIDTVSITITSHPLRYKGKWSKYRVHGQISFDVSEMVAIL